MSELVNYELESGIARISFDDGKANVMSLDMLRALHAAFDRAGSDEAIIILTGRENVFSAGFDMNVFARNNAEESHGMLRSGAELALRLLEYPWPVIVASNGHALPMGAFLMLTSDIRLGVDGPFRIGLNEVLIGLTIPHFAIEIARYRLTPPYFNRIVTGELLSPAEALTAGYLDRLTSAEELLPSARQIAGTYVDVDLTHFAATKKRVRSQAVAAVRTAIDTEITLENYKRRFERA
ncbi:MAG: crotonase/enoyl-CoA hydratase family protein [Afipia sp.]|uniref:crotonase/enoyl-CoA hydratase family protein n=1 Tax=Parvibaculum sp. TaxID=2024848 RepID=UPI002731828F|nr:crotonase/enoyl-CoA hydratase family protein [Parvibaculum sp.]MDP2149563.1 crotonase/enoyl-CoA hydratase family protein [Parvibaculum sp.]MDZ4365995.1 crotonase/enoyl-CoA hydratase family protein [Afipia sp.]